MDQDASTDAGEAGTGLGTSPGPGGVLAAARRLRAVADAAEVGVLDQAVAWCRLHEVADADQAATWGECPVPIAGQGAPLVAEFCVAEFAAVLGMSTDAGRRLLAHALELAYRLPRLWARVRAGEVAVWRARRVAEETLPLCADAAGFIDAAVADFAERVGPAQLDRLVAEATARFDPESARLARERAADGRHFAVEAQQASFSGTCWVHGELDLADALDLEAAVAAGAAALAGCGSTEPLEVRRALAVGELSRSQLALAFDTQSRCADAADGPAAAAPAGTVSRPRREAILYVHLAADAVDTWAGGAGPETSGTGWLENHGRALVTAQTIREWLGAPGTTVTVRPVVDLATEQHAAGYRIPATLREQVILRDRTCVFPWCNRSARRADIDHIVPYDQGGTTNSSNLAPLCRRHHRCKTFGAWSYRVIEPGSYQWTSPTGHRYHRDRSGTRCLTPAPVSPPGTDPPHR